MSANPLGIDPVLFSLGSFQVRWYGLMYVCGFVLGGFILGKLSDSSFLKLNREQIDKYVTKLIIGMFIGARVFYVFIYNWDQYSNDIGSIFAVWEGGLSFHGGAFGMCLVTYLTTKKYKLHFFQLADCMAVAGTIGLFFGRMGNFINGELYGRVTDSPLGLVFPNGGPYPRHPSQLYEGVLEGIVLFSILWFLHKRQKIYGIVSAAFLMGYGTFRYIVEFFREADVQLGYYFGGTTTMGQILCMIMILGSIGVYFYARKVNIPNPLYTAKPSQNT